MRAFIFDMDGVLVDTQCIHSQTTAAALNEAGISCSWQDLSEFAGTKRGFGITTMAERQHVSVDIEAVCERKEELFLAEIHQRQLEPIDGIPALLKSLRAHGVHTAIASSSAPSFIDYIVDTIHIRGYFEELISGQTLPRSKPDPAIYLLAAKRLGVRPRDCVVLEDAGMGVQAAKAAGMYCIGYRNPNSGQQDLSLADQLVDHISEIDIEKL